MRQLCSSISLIVVLLSSGLIAQNQVDIKVEDVAICTSVEDRQPVGTDSVFTADVGQLYCFTKLRSQTDTSEVSHVWFYQDKQMAKVDLTMKAKTWRTWSSKQILSEWTGNWRVEIQDSAGDVISSISFKVE